MNLSGLLDQEEFLDQQEDLVPEPLEEVVAPEVPEDPDVFLSVNTDDQEVITMANNLANQEAKVKEKLNDRFVAVEALWELEGSRARTRQLKAQLDAIAEVLTEWHEVHTRLLAKQEPNAKKDFQKNFLKEFQVKQVQLEENYCKYEELDGPAQRQPDNNVTVAKGKNELLKSKMNSSLAQATALKAKIVTENKEEPLAKTKCKYYASALEELQQDMQGFEELVSEITTLHPADAQTYLTSFATELAKIKTLYNEAHAELASLGVSEEVYTGVNPSPRSSIIQIAGQEMAAPKVQKKYQYKLQDIPSFTKDDVASFPYFYKEWHESVMPGQDPAWVLRQLNT